MQIWGMQLCPLQHQKDHTLPAPLTRLLAFAIKPPACAARSIFGQPKRTHHSTACISALTPCGCIRFWVLTLLQRGELSSANPTSPVVLHDMVKDLQLSGFHNGGLTYLPLHAQQLHFEYKKSRTLLQLPMQLNKQKPFFPALNASQNTSSYGT